MVKVGTTATGSLVLVVRFGDDDAEVLFRDGLSLVQEPDGSATLTVISFGNAKKPRTARLDRDHANELWAIFAPEFAS